MAVNRTGSRRCLTQPRDFGQTRGGEGCGATAKSAFAFGGNGSVIRRFYRDNGAERARLAERKMRKNATEHPAFAPGSQGG
jgi:hypothetical protein